MAKASKAQTRAVKKYQSKMHRFTMLFSESEYQMIIKTIYPCSASAYIKELIRADIRNRALIRASTPNASNKGSNSLI